MTILVAEIYVNDSPTKHNRDLTSYLFRNLQVVIYKGRIKFRFKKIKPREFTQLREMGIKALPAMIIGGKKYVSVPIIIEEIQNRVKTSQKTASVKTDDEMLNDYFKREIGDPQKGLDGKIDINNMDQENVDRVDLSSAVLREKERRSGGQQYNNPLDPQARPTPHKASWDHRKDDDYTDREPPQRPQQRPQYAMRQDNIDPGDPMAALQAVQRKEGTSQDDELVQMMLSKSE